MLRMVMFMAVALLVTMAALDPASSQSGFTGAAQDTSAGQVRTFGFVDRLTTAIRVRQQQYYRQFGEAIRALKSGYSGEATLALILVSFVYGVFHAAGPGHGKAVISAYMLANERSVRRGVILSSLAAAAQALTAILAVYGFVLILDATGREAQLLSGNLELVSYAMIIAVGAWLTWRALAPVLRTAPAGARRFDHHDADHAHCGHAHFPDAAVTDRPLTLATAGPIIASIGLRPCSGAIVVLIFAHTLGLYLAGVAAAFAMAVGTAITVAALATLAVGSREFAAWAIGRQSAYGFAFYRVVAITGSLAVLGLGVMLLHAALTVPARPFM